MVQVVVKTCQDSNNTQHAAYRDHSSPPLTPPTPQRTVPRPALASTRSCKGCSILSHFRDPQQPSFLFWDCLIKWRKSEKEFLVVGQDRTSFNMGVFSDRPTVHEAFCQGNKVLELVATPLCTATQLDFAATLKADSIGNQGQAMSSSGTCAKA